MGHSGPTSYFSSAQNLLSPDQPAELPCAGNHTAHVSTADLAAYSTFFRGLMEAMTPEEESAEELLCVRVPITTDQRLLHGVVEALYAGHLKLGPACVEAHLRVADFLGLNCISETCQEYITRIMLPHCPVKVCRSVYKMRIASML